MTKYEKLQVIERAYHMLIPCIKNNAVQDYGLILVEAPNCPSCVRTWYFSSLDQPFSIFSTDSQLSLPRISSNTLMPPFTAQKALSYESAFSHNQYW